MLASTEADRRVGTKNVERAEQWATKGKGSGLHHLWTFTGSALPEVWRGDSWSVIYFCEISCCCSKIKARKVRLYKVLASLLEKQLLDVGCWNSTDNAVGRCDSAVLADEKWFLNCLTFSFVFSYHSRRNTGSNPSVCVQHGKDNVYVKLILL